MSFETRDAFPETANTARCVQCVREACRAANVACAELASPYRASEDFGRLIKAAGDGALFYMGSGVCMHELHTPEYDFPDEIIENISNVMLALAAK